MLLSPPDRDPAALPRLAATVLLLALLVPGLRWTEFDPGVFFDARQRETMGQFFALFLPPALDPEFLRLTLRATLETLAMATAGTFLAMVIAFPLAFAVARSLSISRIGPGPGRRLGQAVRGSLRLFLAVLRGVPEIVWALLLVRAVGLGPAAAVLAIAVSYGGMLGKVYGEIFESADTRPARALLEAGSGRLGAFFYGVLPAAAPEVVSYSVYRWECAVRASVIMGFVGAGGLGQQMELSMRMLEGGEVCTLLLTFLLLVLLADGVSAILRRAVA
jgi:phosphonate transport system permease protein